jgi:hypothetical protein
VRRSCICMGRTEKSTRLLWDSPNERDNSEDRGIGGRME